MTSSLVATCYFIVWIYDHLFSQYPTDGFLGSYWFKVLIQSLLIMNLFNLVSTAYLLSNLFLGGGRIKVNFNAFSVKLLLIPSQ